jgi:hypothetical protein
MKQEDMKTKTVRSKGKKISSNTWKKDETDKQ